MQNDAYRLRILLPLLELLHHYCINQRSIQHAAEYVAQKFVTCLLRPERRTTLHTEEAALAISASTTMILEYRTLLGQSIVEFDAKKAQLRPRRHFDVSQQMGKLQSAKSCPMPVSPMAAKRLPSSGLHMEFQSEPEDFEHSIQAAKACTSPSFLDSPMSDDIDSAFSSSSVELDESGTHSSEDSIDADLANAVNSLFLESTSDVLFTSSNIKPSFGLAPIALDQHTI